ncbi:MAG: hypothetical protein GQ525_16575 [Draconibacterium sp.]|nr:hypothetical protein [Draconibacterium sp.]
MEDITNTENANRSFEKVPFRGFRGEEKLAKMDGGVETRIILSVYKTNKKM